MATRGAESSSMRGKGLHNLKGARHAQLGIQMRCLSCDVMAIENTASFKGLYHVLGGLISPMDGIGPSQLHIETLCEKAARGEVQEVIAALSTTMEGDTTLFYLSKKLKPFDIKISTLARGVAIGGALEYADEVTLGRSIINRVPYENQIVR
jgi:recombination protein RecR